MNVDYYGMDTMGLWQMVLGVLLPLAIAVVTKATWKPGVKSGVMLAMVFVTTLIGEVIGGALKKPQALEDYVRDLMVVFMLTVTTYRHIWRPTGVAGRIEDATTPSTAPKPSEGAVEGSGVTTTTTTSYDYDRAEPEVVGDPVMPVDMETNEN